MTFPTFAEVLKEAQRKQRELAHQGKRMIFALPKEAHWSLLSHFGKLERLYGGWDKAAADIKAATGVPLCVDNCGLCCTRTTPFSTGVEAEYAASWLLGNPIKLNPILDRIESWLTSKDRVWTYGNRTTRVLQEEVINHEMSLAASERCPFLEDDLRCGIYDARPSACRAYGVTHLPNTWCARPKGVGETSDGYITWDANHPSNPIHAMWDDLNKDISDEPKWSREGFFPTMVFERFRADRLAALFDDGKIPMAKMIVGWDGQRALLWQEQLDQQWQAEEADKSIDDQVPLVTVDGVPRMRVGTLPNGVIQ